MKSVECIAGGGTDATAKQALKRKLHSPGAVVVDGNDGVIFAEGAHVVTRIDADGTLTHLAGLPGSDKADEEEDGIPATEATLWSVNGLAVAPSGIVFLTDRYSVRAFEPGGSILHIAGKHGKDASSTRLGSAAKTAALGGPRAIAVLPDERVVFADTNELVFIDPKSKLRPLVREYHSDVIGLAPWGDGLLVAESDKVFVWRPDGTYEHLAGDPPGEGSGTAFKGDRGPAVDANLFGVRLMAAVGDDVFVLDWTNSLRVIRGGAIHTVCLGSRAHIKETYDDEEPEVVIPVPAGVPLAPWTKAHGLASTKGGDLVVTADDGKVYRVALDR